MRNRILFHPAVLVVALTLPAVASAASAPESAAKTAPVAEQGNFTWSAAAGLGYDSNVYEAPRAPYVDYALAAPALVTPQAKSGFFVPYELKADMTKIRNRDSRMLASAKADGNFYLGSSLSNANEFNLGLNGGFEYVLAREGRSEDTLYVGALFENHQRVYVDHDSGLGKTTSSTLKDISALYSYIKMGVEAKYKHRVGDIEYGINGQYAINDYENPAGAPQQDHTYYTLGADTSIPVATRTDLNLSFDHSVRDYSNRHSRTLQAAFTTSLLAYTYNTVGATLRNRISPDWLLYLDFDHSRRADNNAGYGDYRENRYGARILYGQGRLKARLALHHWGRDYPNAFAFDVAGQATKTYSGNVLKLKAELEQTKNTALWTELVYEAQNTTDLRYDYVRKQIMAGMSWAY